MKKPLILSPAGSPEALYAALEAGADEVYFGIGTFNARAGAKNFTEEEAAEALRICRLRGVHTNITLNTLLTDRELPEAVKTAYFAASHGADAFIVQDLGLADVLRKAIPGIILHASTQCAVHNTAGASFLAEHGFSRVVLAREMDEESIRAVTSLGIETEIFVHGALCVCHSGMCLMSSVIGARSGNRGLCAQPCRLPYAIDKEGKAYGQYPLSLKDLSLARHVSALCALGVTSLKIEGRMKSPDYVYDVTHLWKTFIAENRAATEEEYAFLEKLFSRGGFTDGYFTGKMRQDNRNLYGIRSENDKAQSRTLKSDACGIPVKRAITLQARLYPGELPTLSASDGVHHVSARGDATLQASRTRPLTREDAVEALTKLGSTHFVCTDIELDLDDRVFAPRAQLNELRRRAAAALEDEILRITLPPLDERFLQVPKRAVPAEKAAKLRLIASTESGAQALLDKYTGMPVESVCLPLGLFRTGIPQVVQRLSQTGTPFGVRLPRVVFTAEEAVCRELLACAKEAGAAYALCENIGHLPLAKEVGMPVYLGYAMNVFNSRAVNFLLSCGVQSVTLSPELNRAQMRDIARCDTASTAVAAAGALELMVLESCVIRARGACRRAPDGSICAFLYDRTGARFAVRCERRLDGDGFPCRNVLLNGIPLRLLEKPDVLREISADVLCVYESPEEERT